MGAVGSATLAQMCLVAVVAAGAAYLAIVQGLSLHHHLDVAATDGLDLLTELLPMFETADRSKADQEPECSNSLPLPAVLHEVFLETSLGLC